MSNLTKIWREARPRWYSRRGSQSHVADRTLEIKFPLPGQAQSDIDFAISSNLHQILISVPTRLANTLMRNESRGRTVQRKSLAAAFFDTRTLEIMEPWARLAQSDHF